MFRCYGARNRNSVVVFTTRCERRPISLKLPESGSSHGPSKQPMGRKANASPQPPSHIECDHSLGGARVPQATFCWHEILLHPIALTGIPANVRIASRCW